MIATINAPLIPGIRHFCKFITKIAYFKTEPSLFGHSDDQSNIDAAGDEGDCYDANLPQLGRMIGGTSVTASENSSQIHSWHQSIQVGMFVSCIPTPDARVADAVAGYTLPFSVGRVVQVKECGVTLSWMHAYFIDGTWNVWEERGQRHVRRALDDVEWRCILRDSAGPIDVGFTSGKLLTKATLTRLRSHAGLADIPASRWEMYFRKRV